MPLCCANPTTARAVRTAARRVWKQGKLRAVALVVTAWAGSSISPCGPRRTCRKWAAKAYRGRVHRRLRTPIMCFKILAMAPFSTQVVRLCGLAWPPG